MDYGLGFLGQYITAAELVDKTPTLTIAKITLEKVESLQKGDDDAPGKMRDRIIIYFKEGKDGRGWLLNRSNAEALKEMWGRETNNWLGHRVTLHTQPVRVGPKVEPGIRVKGSPDLKEPHTFQLKLPRRKPMPYTLLPTGSGKASPQNDPPPMDVDTTTGEITPSAEDWVAPYLDRIADATGTESLKSAFDAAKKEAYNRGHDQGGPIMDRIVAAKDAKKALLAAPTPPKVDAMQAVMDMPSDSL